MDPNIDPVTLTSTNGIARIALNRPEAGNALDLPTVTALLDAVITCEHDPATRVVMLTGRGKLFCAGGDLGAFQTAGLNLGAYLAKLATLLHGAVTRLAAMPKPVISVVQGPAAGAGMSLALAASYVLAGEKSSFTTAYSKIGLTADGGMTWLLPRLVGLRRATELMTSSRTVTASEALEIGLVSELIEDGKLEQSALELASTLADGPVDAIGHTMALLLRSFDHSLEHHLECELSTIAAAACTPECREGLRAYYTKTKADFRSTARPELSG